MTTSSVESIEQTAERLGVDLATLIAADPHRPGIARYRLTSDNVPIWAVIGHARAVTRDSNLHNMGDAQRAAIARDLDISDAAVIAALLFYARHQAQIDTLLAENAAALYA